MTMKLCQKVQNKLCLSASKQYLIGQTDGKNLSSKSSYQISYSLLQHRNKFLISKQQPLQYLHFILITFFVFFRMNLLPGMSCVAIDDKQNN